MIRYPLFEMCMAIAAVAFVVSAPAAETKDRGILFSESFDDPNVVKRGWYDSVKIKISDRDAYAGAGCIEYVRRSPKAIRHGNHPRRRQL